MLVLEVKVPSFPWGILTTRTGLGEVLVTTLVLVPVLTTQQGSL